jgi:hypothetical protein
MKMDKELIEEVNNLLNKEPCVMLEFYDNRVFYIVKHWKYLQLSFAPRLHLCRGKKPTDVHMLRNKYLYIQGKEHFKELLNESNKANSKSNKGWK